MSAAAIALNRFGLGARPDDSLPANPRGYLIDQLARFEAVPAALIDQPGRATIIEAFGAYRMVADEQKDLREAGDMADPMKAAAAQEARRDSRRDVSQYYFDGVAARLQASLVTDTPFAERLVHFWSNHFAVSADKLQVVALAADYEFSAIRPHLGGSFADMAWAAVTHPAMLMFLDQAQSVGPDSPLAQRRAARGQKERGLNENLGREIMELHTLGVRSGYSQADVTEFARALTGYTVAGIGGGAGAKRMAEMAGPGETVFVDQLHQPGARTIMGKTYNQPGQDQARAIFADLVRHPATANHIATKLARHFVADDPPPALVSRLAEVFTRTGGNLPALHRALVEAPESWNPAVSKFKSPWDWSVSALRAIGTATAPGKRSGATMLQQLGQPVWKPGSPAGYDDTSAAWAGAGALMTRVELAERLAGRAGDRVDARKAIAVVLPDSDGMTAQAITRAESPAQALALMIASPEFMRR